jgi:hypothetical protein
MKGKWCRVNPNIFCQEEHGCSNCNINLESLKEMGYDRYGNLSNHNSLSGCNPSVYSLPHPKKQP